MGKGKKSKKEVVPAAFANLMHKKIGDPMTDGHIGQIYFVTPKHLIYTSAENPSVLSYVYKNEKSARNLVKIMPSLVELRNLLSSREERASYLSQIASVYSLCFDDDTEGALRMITDIIKDIKTHRRDRNNAQLTYVGICLLIVLVNVTTMFVFKYETIIPKDAGLWLYCKAALWGSFGGFISITYKLNKYDYNFNTSKTVRVLSAISRIFISMLSSLFVLVLIQGNIALGFIGTLSIANPFVVYSFSVLSGFSESFVPDLLQALEKKSTKEGTEKKP